MIYAGQFCCASLGIQLRSIKPATKTHEEGSCFDLYFIQLFSHSDEGQNSSETGYCEKIKVCFYLILLFHFWDENGKTQCDFSKRFFVVTVVCLF